jgi:uncharacterized protein involved in exopolysaccharide biosynthesis
MGTKKPTDAETAADLKNKLARQVKLTKSAKERGDELSKDLGKAKARIKSLQSEAKLMEKQHAEEIASHDAVPAERYMVVARQEMPVAGKQRPAGTVIGFITAVEGAEPELVAHALYRSKASIKPTAETYTAQVHVNVDEDELKKLVDDACEKLKDTYEGRIAELEQQLAEATAESGDEQSAGSTEQAGDE